jgi:voltage-gated potassium channel
MNSNRHLVFGLLLSGAIVFVGTIGYMVIEKWPLLDALYMTVITIATVGYSEVRPLDLPGRLFTIGLVFLGVGSAAYIAGAVVQFMVEGRIRVILGRRKLDRKINRLRNHYIVCGYGRIGRVLCDNLRRKIRQILVIESNPERIAQMEADNVVYLSGDASEESVLQRAGIERATGLVAVLGSDTQNVFLVLTARQLNPALYIIARAGAEASKGKLSAAGADFVQSPYELGALSMAQRILRPTVTSFLDLAISNRNSDIQMEEIPVAPSSDLVDKTLKDSGIRQKYNLIIIAIKSGCNGDMLFNPSFESVIRSGDTLIAVGPEANLKRLEEALNPEGLDDARRPQSRGS